MLSGSIFGQMIAYFVAKQSLAALRGIAASFPNEGHTPSARQFSTNNQLRTYFQLFDVH